MIEQKQANYHKPNEGIIGDCFRTCVANVLNLSRDSVPHVYQEAWKDGGVVSQEAITLMNNFLSKYGLRYVETPLQADEEQLRIYLNHYYKDLHIIVGCSSKNGGHAVVMKNYDYMYDPSLDNSGCVGPMEDGFYWLGMFVRDL